LTRFKVGVVCDQFLNSAVSHESVGNFGHVSSMTLSFVGFALNSAQ
jgi:hypothetical protein